MRQKSSLYEIKICENDKELLIFTDEYWISSNKYTRELYIILDNLIRNKIEDGEYTVRISLNNSKSIRRTYKIKLITKNVKILEYELIKTESRTVARYDVKGEIEQKIKFNIFPIFIPDYTIYDVKQF